MNLTYFVCSFCQGKNHTEEYKLNQKNFSTVRVEMNSPQNHQLVPPISQRTATVCNECLASADNPIQPLIDVMIIASTNDAETAKLMNK